MNGSTLTLSLVGALAVGAALGRRGSRSELAPWRNPEATDLSPRMQRAVALFEQIKGEVTDGVWSCNGGAAVFAWICDRLGLPRKLRVGVYWWEDNEASLRHKRTMMGYEELPLDGVWRDEHHHWVEVKEDAAHYIVDPNGEIRGEPRVSHYWNVVAVPVSSKWSFGRRDPEYGYAASNRKEDFLIYAPTHSIRSIAKQDKEVARGIARVDAHLGRTGEPPSKPARWPR